VAGQRACLWGALTSAERAATLWRNGPSGRLALCLPVRLVNFRESGLSRRA
jgi:hypothetical protein